MVHINSALALVSAILLAGSTFSIPIRPFEARDGVSSSSPASVTPSDSNSTQQQMLSTMTNLLKSQYDISMYNPNKRSNFWDNLKRNASNTLSAHRSRDDATAFTSNSTTPSSSSNNQLISMLTNVGKSQNDLILSLEQNPSQRRNFWDDLKKDAGGVLSAAPATMGAATAAGELSARDDILISAISSANKNYYDNSLTVRDSRTDLSDEQSSKIMSSNDNLYHNSLTARDLSDEQSSVLSSINKNFYDTSLTARDTGVAAGDNLEEQRLLQNMMSKSNSLQLSPAATAVPAVAELTMRDYIHAYISRRDNFSSNSFTSSNTSDSIGEDAELAQNDLQNMVQQQQNTLQTLSNLAQNESSQSMPALSNQRRGLRRVARRREIAARENLLAQRTLIAELGARQAMIDYLTVRGHPFPVPSLGSSSFLSAQTPSFSSDGSPSDPGDSKATMADPTIGGQSSDASGLDTSPSA